MRVALARPRASRLVLLSLLGVAVPRPGLGAGYRWGQVVIGGGGPVNGIAPHPRVRGLLYLRTSHAGFFRLDEGSRRWQPLSDRFPFFQQNLYGGEGLALDPQDPGRLYLAAGKDLDGDWGDGVLLRSQDRGRTLLRGGLRLAMGGAGDRPWLGERLAVDPFQPQVLLFGSRRDGLLRSTDHGETFTPIKGLPATLTRGMGVVAVLFDPGREGLVYVNAYDDGVYVSRDHGLTFQRLHGSPTEVLGMALGREGALYLTAHSPQGIFKAARPDGEAQAPQDITPPGGHPGFGPIAVDPSDGEHVVAAYDPQGAGGVLWRSLDGGQRWQLKDRFAPTRGAPFWSAAAFASTVTALAFDPQVAGRLYLADRFGVWRSDDLAADAPVFTSLAAGHEQHAVLALLAPPGPRAGLLSGVAEQDGFFHDPAGPALAGFQAPPRQPLGGDAGPRWQTTYDLAFCESQPARLWRVGGTRETTPPSGGVASSPDGGRTWTAARWFGGLPLRVAVAAQTPQQVVVLTQSGLMRSGDSGATWAAADLRESEPAPAPVAAPPGKRPRRPTGSQGPAGSDVAPWELAPESGAAPPAPPSVPAVAPAPDVLIKTEPGALPDGAQPLAADRAEPGRFYYVADGRLYRSGDGGKTFGRVTGGLPTGRWQVLRAQPGVKQALWLALDHGGLLRSPDGGKTFARVPGVKWAHQLAFGKAPPGGLAAAVYLFGVLASDPEGQPAVYRSLDQGQSWLRISVPEIALGAGPQVLEASREHFGVVFVGTAGRGIFIGAPF